MLGTEPVFADLSRALDRVVLEHSVHASNIANASTEGYQRLEVMAADPVSVIPADPGDVGMTMPAGEVVHSATETVRLDQELAQMQQNALRFQSLLAAFQRTAGLLKMAIHEGREG